MDVILAYKWYEKINEVISANFLRELHESEEIIENNPKANASVLGSKTGKYYLPFSPIKYFTE